MKIRRTLKFKKDKSKRAKKSKAADTSDQNQEQRYNASRKYGRIPMIEKTVSRFETGKKYTYWTHDPDFQPELPKGAIRGDVQKQVYCPMCWEPKYYYLDIKSTCIQCGQEFVFAASEQKYWYETLKFHFASVAIRCPKCRRQQRSERAIKKQKDEVLGKMKERPDDPVILIAVAEATIQQFDRLGTGNLNLAIAVSRKALKISPHLCEALYWEAVCQERASRKAKSIRLFRDFIESAINLKRAQTLVKKARAQLKKLETEQPPSNI